ncbi:AfsR/SARP family transcriptional regulator [Micromonospora zingiberis]|uniref:AfsR/SARP family transcriptional regulator n=1 Tax=Micromonospora zingiberis TaxID=2053011 RepID=UPI0013F3A2A5|nr:BTAD domain-containing putative transcriptional regulator [Micromonospora zingiberis]
MSTVVLLGQVRVCHSHVEVDLGPPKRRAVFAALAADPAVPVPVSVLVRRVWDDEPPAAARDALYVHVMHLRRALAGEDAPRLVRARDGYQLDIDPDAVDLHRFIRIIDAAAALHDDPSRQAAQLRAALDLWRGAPFAGLPGAWFDRIREDLRRQHLSAIVTWAGCELRLGEHRRVLAEVPRLAAEQPLVEPLVAVTMRALCRAGRTAEALESYANTRALLAERLGVEPGSELRELHLAILRGTDRDDGPGAPVPLESTSGARGTLSTPHPPAGPPPTPTVPRQLPPAPELFVGRHTEMELLGRLGKLTMICGMAGVGKTALALNWAHRQAPAFPDGQLYVNLRGWDEEPALTPQTALVHLLTGLGVPAHQVPADVELAASMFRTMTAARQVLVLLDNAGSAEQVRQLLPAGPGCRVVVTGRERLAGLVAQNGATEIDIDVLDIAEASTLLERVLGGPRPGIAELARACGQLPLALRIAGATVVSGARVPVDVLVERLNSDQRLGALAIHHDASATVQRAFDHSYAALDPLTQRLFRLLGNLPVTSFSAGLAGALLEAPVDDGLERLVAAHLLLRVADDRYTFHDLLKEYARDRAARSDSDDVRQASIRRGYDWFLRRARSAAHILYPQLVRLEPEPEPVFAEAADAVLWLRTEEPQLAEMIVAAESRGESAMGWRLADSLRGHFMSSRNLVLWDQLIGIGLAAAQAQGDVRAQAAMHLAAGVARVVAGQHDDAVEHCRRAATLSEQAGWTVGLSSALTTLGVRHAHLGDTAEAARCTELALTASRSAGRLASVAINLNNLAAINIQLGRFAIAGQQLAEALRLHTGAGTRRGAASVMVNLGSLHYAQGRPERAERYLRHSADIYHGLADREGAASALSHLALVQLLLVRPGQALHSARSALAAVRGTGDPHTEALALISLATVHGRYGRHHGSLLYLRRALRLAEDTADRQWVCLALLGTAEAQLAVGLSTAAAVTARRALDLARSASYTGYEGQALAMLGRVMLVHGAPEDAVDFALRAVDVQRRTGHRLGLARSLRLLAQARAA